MDTISRPSIEQGSSAIQRVSAFREFARLGFKGGAMLTAVIASLCAIVLFVPDSNDYSLVTLLKHQRLAQYESRKIVLVGGSNLPFGIDSTMIRRATGCPVVNMGMNGYLGVRYMLEEVKPQLKPSDVVVLAFEWDSFYKSVDGTGLDLLAIVKANPTAFTYLSHKQMLRVIAAIPLVAQQKVLHIISQTMFWVDKRATVGNKFVDEEYRLFWDVVLTAASTTPDGDLVGHVGVAWPYPRRDGTVPNGAPIEPQMISLLRDFAAEMTKRDVAVLVSYTPVMRRFYDRHQNDFDHAHQMISATPPLVAPSPPSSFVYDEAYFFDTVYHMNAEGRTLRTQRLIQDLEAQWHGRAHCPQAAAATAGE